MSYVRIIEDTFFAVCRYWGGLQNAFDVFGPVRAMQTGIASADLNMVWSEAPLTREDAPWVRQVEKYYETASLPYWWWIFPRAKTAETIRLLKDTGHVHLLNMPCLLADLSALPKAKSCGPPATIREVGNQEDLALWQEVTFAGFDFSQGDRTSYDRFAGAFSLDPGSPQKPFWRLTAADPWLPPCFFWQVMPRASTSSRRLASIAVGALVESWSWRRCIMPGRRGPVMHRFNPRRMV